MRALTLQEMASSIGGRVFGEITTPQVLSVSTDTRTLQKGALFFAIKGDHFDGHDYVEEALAMGAAAVVVSGDSGSALPADWKSSDRFRGRLIEVPDTVTALGRLAGWYRNQIAAQVIAVFGSNGKTTTKDMIFAVLKSKMRGKAAPASFNNAIGVPLTLLSVDPSDEFVVVEVGTNHPGEIAALARIVRPDMAVVTSIGEEHLATFQDLRGVASEEFSFLTAMKKRAFVTVNDQAAEYLPRRLWAGGDGRSVFNGRSSDGLINANPLDTTQTTILTYGFSEKADLRAVGVRTNQRGQRFLANGRFEYSLPLIGRHNVCNALAAIAMGTRFRLDHDQIAKALAKVQPPSKRLQIQRCGTICIINDAYNANPDSVRAAILTLDEMVEKGRKVLILGDMRELGRQAVRCHQQIGQMAGRSTAHVIISVGKHARVIADGAISIVGTNKRIYPYPTIQALMEKLPKLLEPNDLVLLKASRAIALEQVVPVIEKRTQSIST